MTRILGELLGVNQPQFTSLIQKLEQAAGRPSQDIRITHEVAQKTREALGALHLDAQDSTNTEIYNALRNKFAADEAYFLESLSVDGTTDSADILAAIQKFAAKHTKGHRVLALKASVFKRLLKTQAPKKTMKQLHYRSVDSMLKHESVASLQAATWLCESEAWQRKLLKQYTQLQPHDFEERDIEVYFPVTDRWQILGESSSASRKQTVLSFAEAGVVVVLPIKEYIPGMAISTAMLALQSCNEVFTASSYMKLQQMTPRFAIEITEIAKSNNVEKSWAADHEVPWPTLHSYFSRHQQHNDYFDPYIQAADLQLLHPEQLIAQTHPSLTFWEQVSHTLKYEAGKIVSFNLLDVAINYSNKLEYLQSVAATAKSTLWQELLMRYINEDIIERRLLPALQPIPQEIETPTSD